MRATRRTITRTCPQCGRQFNVTIDLEYPTADIEAIDVCRACVEDEIADDDAAFERDDDQDSDDEYA